MKKVLRILMILILFACVNVGCEEISSNSSSSSDTPCGYHNGKRLYKGPRGGCYYMNSNNNKTYVDRSECHC